MGNVLGYANGAGGYITNQNYEYDGLYQITGAKGQSTQYLYEGRSIEGYRADYEQTFEYDIIGNMTKKTSRESKTQRVRNGMELNYNFDYEYYGNSHKAERIGDMYYRYDGNGNGNVVEERYGGHGTANTGSAAYSYEDGVYSADYGFALTRPTSGVSGTSGGGTDSVYERRYTWDYRNQLLKTKDNRWTVNYRYGHDGQRTVKYTEETRNETLYFNSMWQTSTSGSGNEWLQSKHIFVGESRIATKSNREIAGKTEGNLSFEIEHQYWYHSDHLGSAQLTTTRSGDLHERIEYTPYGEIWVEHKYDYTEGSLPYRFTGKELDEETGYYYYGARYLDPRTSRWISTDPAMGDYIPSAPVNDEAKKRNGNLPGMGGLFNVVNMHVYHYAGNNPIKYIDPDGRDGERPRHNADPMYIRVLLNTTHTYSISNRISMQDAFNSDDGPCTFRSLLGIAESRVGRNLTMSELNKARKKYYGSNENSDWTVDIGRADGKNLSGTPLADVINIGLELLGSKERASYINKEDPLSIPEGTQATLLRIDADTSSGYHFLEGDANGNKIFEPLQRMDDYKDSPVNRISSFKFYTPQKQE